MLQNANHRLRALEPEDIEVLLRWENDASNWWLGASLTPYSRATLLKFATGDHDIYRDRQLRLILDYKGEDDKWQTVGVLDLYDFDVRNLRAGVGVVIDEEYKRKGHATAGLGLLEKYAQKHLCLNQIFAEIPAKNVASRKLFFTAGYVECELRKSWIRSEDVWEDVVLTQLIFQLLT